MGRVHFFHMRLACLICGSRLRDPRVKRCLWGVEEARGKQPLTAVCAGWSLERTAASKTRVPPAKCANSHFICSGALIQPSSG